MVLATRCPHCATAFRVVTDQIKLRGGWVRCGVCNEVFDSAQNLMEVQMPAAPFVPPPFPASAAPAGSAPTGLPPAAAPAAAGDAAAAPSVLRSPRRGSGLPVPPEPDGDAPAPRPAAAVETAEQDPGRRGFEGERGFQGNRDFQGNQGNQDFHSGHDFHGDPDLRGDRDLAEPDPSSWTADGFMPPITADVRPPRGPSATPDFLDDDARLRRRQAQWWWGLAGLIALLVLLAQAVWIFRTELATRLPVVRPLLEQMCLRLSCTVGYPRAPELLVIESSSVEPWAPDSPGHAPPIVDAAAGPSEDPSLIELPVRRLALKVVLRNRATFPQAWPAIELSLMDVSDAVAARRILLPSVYLSPREFAAPIGAREERVLRIPIETVDAHATGYRVAIFYP